jgi:hypothetical protein
MVNTPFYQGDPEDKTKQVQPLDSRSFDASDVRFGDSRTDESDGNGSEGTLDLALLPAQG